MADGKKKDVIEGEFVEEAKAAETTEAPKAEPENGLVNWAKHNWGWVLAGLAAVGTAVVGVISVIGGMNEHNAEGQDILDKIRESQDNL